ncbi:rhomboid family intramembrane serine protease [Aliiglaciecola sp. 2_MG-2023]|uniref:rhomboid family intramembrane serine protease n=1 Tax=unclassified Aliiglaciecola TaxID=2593648 RepID=UPI0026E14E6D|nr:MULTISPECIES: rhomboid family intramembrane serine protease [unclassified Aliiglaciecola]MDO6709974.1 rhomboid family intramembrane serine protease [Aliiglaciecola sp. 2_MG-2023]MDO6751122.1 rhomboid family intramembrane serine protease [Aliiglaciecola sp. 1_MG-2023]
MGSKTTALASQLKFVLYLMLFFAVIEGINILFGRSLNIYGIYPRELIGLRGIIFSPFLHGNLSHFASNIITLGIFSLLVMQYGKKTYITVSIYLMLSIGVLVWLFARPAMHIGASGIIYGYFGFLVLGGLISGRIKLIIISLIVGFFYGGLIFGVIPSNAFVSWESHLFGFIAGLCAAKLWAKKR